MAEIVEDVPLSTLFEQAEAIHSQASCSELPSDELSKGCRILHQCQERIDKLGIFSANEDKEDIGTTDLKYLLVPFYLGELTEKLPATDRLDLLGVAKSYLKTFIRTCENLELVPPEELQILFRESPADPATRRSEKIMRFKRQKAAESKLQEIRERKERRKRSMQAAGKASTVEDGEEILADEDDEEARDAWFMHISIALCKALDLLEMLQREEQMLVNMKAENAKSGMEEMLNERHSKADAWHREAASKAKFSKPTQPITCATFAQDVIEGRSQVSRGHQHGPTTLLFGPASVVGGSITTERERLAAQVFQPSYRLPTMSIEEAGLKEMEMMKNWSETTAKMQEEATSSWTNDKEKGNESDDEAAEMKARAWDDWKDENPRGSGNKKLTPCG